MEKFQRLYNTPTCRLILWGLLKSLIVAIVASLALALYAVYRMYGPSLEGNFHFFGTARQFFPLAVLFVSGCSIPVAAVTAVLLSLFIRAESLKDTRSGKRTFSTGFLLGAAAGAIAVLVVTVRVFDVSFAAIVTLLTGLSGGLTGLWMLVDARRLWPAPILSP